MKEAGATDDTTGGPTPKSTGPDGGSKVIRGMGWNFFGMIIGSLAGFISSILLARFLGSREYGNLALTLSVLNILTIVSALGFEFALNKYIPILLAKNDPDGIKRLVGKLTMIKLAVAISLALFVFCAADILAGQFFGKPSLSLYLRVVAFLVVPASLEPVYRALLTGFYLQKFINLLDATTKVLYLVAAAVVLVVGYGVTGVLLATLLSQLVFVVAAARKGLAAIPDSEGHGRSVTLKKVLKYSFYLYLYSIMNFILGQQLDLIMIGAMLDDTSQVAFYTISYSFAYTSLSFFSLVLGGGITLTYFSELFTKKDFAGLRRGYTVMVEYLFVYIIPIGIAGCVLSRELLFVLFGSEFATSEAVMLLLLYFPTMAVMKFGGVTSTFLSAMDQEKKLVVSRTIFGGVNIVLNLLLIPYYKAFGALIGTGVASIVGLFYESYVVHRCLKPSYPGRFLVKMLAISFAGGTVIFAIKYLMLSVMALPQGAYGAGLVLAGAGLPGLAVMGALFIAFKPLSGDTVNVIRNVNIPGKRFVVRLIERK